MEWYMYNPRSIELRGRPALSLEAYTVFRVERAADGALIAMRFGRELLIHSERRFVELAAALVPVEFILDQEPSDEDLRLVRKSIERQVLSWRCEDLGLGRDVGALLLALVDSEKIERGAVEALLKRIDDEAGGWSFDRLYYLALGQFATGRQENGGLQGDALAG